MPRPSKISLDFSSTVLDIMDHLQWSYGSRRGYAVLGLWNYEADKLKQHWFMWPRDKDQISSFLTRHIAEEWTEIFYCPLLRQTTLRTLGNATHHDLLWADVDGGLPEAMQEVLKGWGARIVFSGSPGSYHIYLKLARSLTQDQHRAYEKALRRFVEADDKIADNDFLKLPGSWNYKNHPSVAENRRLANPVMSIVLTEGRVIDDISQYLNADQNWEQQAVKQDTWDGQVKEFRKLPDVLRQLQDEQSQGDGSGRYRRAYNAVRLVAEVKNPNGTRRFTLEDCHSILNDYDPGVDKFHSRWHSQITKIWQDWENEHKALLTMDDAAESTFWPSRDTLKHIYTCATLGRVSPWAVLGVVLARVLTMVPHTVMFPGYRTKSLNLYVGLIGKSGMGKGAATSIAEYAVDLGSVPTVELGTGAGLAAAYKAYDRKSDSTVWKSRAMLFMTPEVGVWASRIMKPDEPLLGWLCQAWSGESLGGKLKTTDLDIRLEPNTYRLCMIMGIQPAMAEPLVRNVSNGTPQRFLWLPAERDEGEVQDLPDPLVWRSPDWPFSEKKKGSRKVYSYEVTFPEEVEKEITEWENIRIRRDNAGQPNDEYGSHEMLLRRKVSVGLMALDGRVEVTSEDWQLAGMVIAKSTARRRQVIRELSEIDAERRKSAARKRGEGKSYEKRAEVQTDRKLEVERRRDMAKRIVAILRKGEISKSALRRKFNDKGLFDEMIEKLMEADRVGSREVEYKGQKGLKLFYIARGDGG